jgi:hypothetical protein
MAGTLGSQGQGAMKTPQKGSRPVSGRKPAQESRATEFRRTLIAWKQTAESSRPSLRVLACELGTSHQLLSFYLKSLEKWQIKEYWRQAREIRARANAEGRPLTQWEEQQVYALNRAAVRATVAPMLLDQIERIKEEFERGPLCWQQIKSLKILARQFPEAQELLRKCSQTDEPKPRKLELSPKQQRLMKTLPKAAARRYKHWLQEE